MASRKLIRGGLPLALLLVLAACSSGQEDLSDLVEPLAPENGAEGDLSAHLEALAPGRGTITVSRERHGSYTSARDNPVEVNLTEESTISFVLTTEDGESFSTSEGSVTWSHSMLATESGECTVVEKAEGSGAFETGPNGPFLSLGMDSDFNIDSNAYILTAMGSPEATTEDDPSTHYAVSSTFCDAELPLEEAGLSWWPFFVDGGTVSGQLNEGSATISGSEQKTVPSLSGEGPSTTVTVTWALRLP